MKGCGSFFCRKAGGGRLEGKNRERNESMKAKKNKRQRSEQIQQVSAGLRDLLGMTEWRKEHPKATWAEIEAAVDEQMHQVRGVFHFFARRASLGRTTTDRLHG